MRLSTFGGSRALPLSNAESAGAAIANLSETPGSAQEKPSQGEVLATGNGQIRDNGDIRALDVKAGDKVLFGQYAGQTVKVDGEELLIIASKEHGTVLEKVIADDNIVKGKGKPRRGGTFSEKHWLLPTGENP